MVHPGADGGDQLLKEDAGVPAPYLLVGHSLGGLYVQRYAQRFPDEVAALLFLDPAHEDWDLYMPEHLQIAKNQPTDTEMPDLPEGFVTQYRSIFADMFAAFPEPVRELLIDKSRTTDGYGGAMRTRPPPAAPRRRRRAAR